MGLRKEFWSQMIFIIMLLTICLLTSGEAQTKKDKTIIFPGMIEQISGDLKWMVVNETKISLTSETRVSDEKGRELKLADLKPNASITIEVVKQNNGFLAKQIVLKPLKR